MRLSTSFSATVNLKTGPDLRGLRLFNLAYFFLTIVYLKTGPDLRGLRLPQGVPQVLCLHVSEDWPRSEGIETLLIKAMAFNSINLKTGPDLRGLRQVSHWPFQVLFP